MLQTDQKILWKTSSDRSKSAFYRELGALDVQKTCFGRQIPTFWGEKPVGVRPGSAKVPIVATFTVV